VEQLDILDYLESKLDKLEKASEKRLQALHIVTNSQYGHVVQPVELDVSYYVNIGRYKWKYWANMDTIKEIRREISLLRKLHEKTKDI